MPRPNKPRDVYAEEYLARRIVLERERRDWTYDGLAQRMTDLGCPLDPSAIYKIEKGKPRRRIVVDELVGFSRVFGLSVEELLLDPDVATEREVVDLVRRWRSLISERSVMVRALNEQSGKIRKRLVSLIDNSPRAENALVGALDSWLGRDIQADWPERVVEGLKADNTDG